MHFCFYAPFYGECSNRARKSPHFLDTEDELFVTAFKLKRPKSRFVLSSVHPQEKRTIIANLSFARCTKWRTMQTLPSQHSFQDKVRGLFFLPTFQWLQKEVIDAHRKRSVWQCSNCPMLNSRMHHGATMQRGEIARTRIRKPVRNPTILFKEHVVWHIACVRKVKLLRIEPTIAPIWQCAPTSTVILTASLSFLTFSSADCHMACTKICVLAFDDDKTQQVSGPFGMASWRWTESEEIEPWRKYLPYYWAGHLSKGYSSRIGDFSIWLGSDRGSRSQKEQCLWCSKAFPGNFFLSARVPNADLGSSSMHRGAWSSSIKFERTNERCKAWMFSITSEIGGAVSDIPCAIMELWALSAKEVLDNITVLESLHA